MELAEENGYPFTWLTNTNKGTSEVCAAALSLMGISEDELSQGYLCDPTQKSDLRILARPGIVLRLTRNDDKQRGFVNGALCNVVAAILPRGVSCMTGSSIFTEKIIDDRSRQVSADSMDALSRVFHRILLESNRRYMSKL